MALQELSAPPPVTGLSALGGVIASHGADYLNRSRQLEDAARIRSQQLADVQSTRDFTIAEADKRRGDSLQDQLTIDAERSRRAGIQILINEGLLDGSQRDNPAAVAAAYQRAQQEGVDKLYVDLTSTPDPDTGRPLLAHADLNNPALVQAAKDKLGVVKAKQLQFATSQQGNAQATVNQLNQQLAQLRQQKDAITRAANEPTPQLSPNDRRVAELAAQLAEQVKPGTGRNREAVAAQLPAALKQLNDQAFIAWSQGVQSAKIELESLRRSEAELTNALERAMGTFRVAPSNTATLAPAALMQPTGNAPAVASAGDIAAAMRAVVGGQPSAPAASGAAASGAAAVLANPTSEPLIEQENTRRAAVSQQKNLFDPYNETLDQLQAVARDIANVRAGKIPGMSPAAGSGPGAVFAPTQLNPSQQASILSDLLQKQQALQAKAAAAKANLFPGRTPPPSSTTLPGVLGPVNTPVASTPTGTPVSNWWQADGPPPIF